MKKIEVSITHTGEDYEASTLDVLTTCCELVGFSEDSAESALYNLLKGCKEVLGEEPGIADVRYIAGYDREALEGFPVN